MATVLVVMSLAVAGGCIVEDLKGVRQGLEVRTRDLVRVVEERTGRTLDTVEQILQRIADGAAVGNLSDLPSRQAVKLSTAPSFVANIYVLDTDGRLVVDGRNFHPAGTAFADRDWVKAAFAAPREGPFIGQVGFDDASRAFAFPVSVRLTNSAGAFIGLAAVLVNSEYSKQYYQDLDLGPGQAFGAYRLDGAVVIRQPMKAEDIGRNFSGTGLYTHLASAPMGTVWGRSPYDTIERVMSYRAIPGRKLVVWVAVADEAVMQSWRNRSLRAGALVALGVATVLGLAVLLWRELARERRATEDLANLNRDLERSNADLEQFAYVASHDLKEPLRNIASYVQLLQRRYQGRLDPDADAFIGYTVDGVRRMQSIINELLAYSRIGTGQLTLVPVQAGILVSTALTHLKGVIAEARAVVEVRGQLPVVEADAAQLGSLFQNLIANALKYRRDDVRPEVEIGYEDRGAMWEFYVRDNGIGIDQQYHRQIFDLFKRLHPRDRYPGTGIGLAICQRVAERHGGRIWVDSRAGEGSTFRFTLPKRRAD
ncbi:MAG TPA: ATP-binding protein [Magnetospirillum sp.]|nr:ATP-binding protein [Magnetospirillum sp.]